MSVASLLLCSFTRPAVAQELVDRSVSIQLFQPFVSPDISLAIERASLFGHLQYGAGLYLNYQRKPFEVVTDAGAPADDPSRVTLVADQLTSDIVGGLGLGYRWLRAQIALALPIHLLVSGSEIDDLGAEEDSFTTGGIGDLRLQLKLGVLDRGRLSLAFATALSLPTGCAGSGGGFGSESCDEKGAYHGDAGATVSPYVIADYRLGAFSVGANLGWLFREQTQVLSTRIDDRLLYGVRASWDTGRRVTVMAELAGQVGFSPSGGCRTYANKSTVCDDPDVGTLETYPLEAMVAGALRLSHGLSVVLGAGAGIIRAIGTPQFRVLSGVRWIPDFTDTDGDGIRDAEDKCPTQAEDRDSFEDADGCPEVDNDGDLIPDERDRCPDKPEDKDSFRDHDGCPEADNDEDGIPDTHDHCPFKPETVNRFRDEDGCPDIPDRDGDGVEDRADLCPDKPETVNGIDDSDGCPDRDRSLLDVKESEIVPRKPMLFYAGRLSRRSHPALEQLAGLLKVRPTLKLRIVGFRGKGGAERRWKKRAEAVQRFLTEKGIAGDRLKVEVLKEVKGSGEKTAQKLERGGILLLVD